MCGLRSGLRVIEGFGFRVHGFGTLWARRMRTALSLEFGIRVSSLGFGVWGLGFTEMCSGYEAGSCSRLNDFANRSTLGLRFIKKQKKVQGVGYRVEGSGCRV